MKFKFLFDGIHLLCFDTFIMFENRKAKPLEKLKEAQLLFVKRMSERLNTSSFGEVNETQP